MAQQPPQWQPPQNWSQYPQQQPPPKRKQSGCLTFAAIVAGIFVVAGIIDAIGGSDEKSTTTTRAVVSDELTTTTKVRMAAAGLHDKVRDGKFEFVVKRFWCPGAICKAQVTVKNIGNEPQTILADNQYLFDTEGRKFEADSTESSDSLSFNELNPGLAASGTIVWTVGPYFTPSHLELHDSVFSDGINVQV
jgi:hypothetical protein